MGCNQTSACTYNNDEQRDGVISNVTDKEYDSNDTYNSEKTDL
jgi:hypothetical protein